MKAEIQLLQGELQGKTLKTVTIEDLQTKMDHISINVANTNHRIDKFEDKFGKRFDKLEELILTRLPKPSRHPESLNQDSDSSTSSMTSNLTSNSTSQIQTRMDYIPKQQRREKADKAKKKGNNNK
ncbi:hypothetical protein GHT06_013492 [Daphnia sinensis]|uniref:Uncharacterized protein n=1 Tax=Daphnia sinensis TaxID=1820382 RepID=A0AAD5PVD3_9CRUS|nr:hypothetical protein GHT06_013492 [Daphnia sinensis]